MTRQLRKRGAVHSSFPRKAEFLQHVRACLELARQEYPLFTLQDHELPIVFIKNGGTIGVARWNPTDIGERPTIFNMEFSIEAIGLDWDEAVFDTIPHELAHIVDRFIHPRSNNHNVIWQRICRKLGGSGKRTHSLKVTKARKSKRQDRTLYIGSCGTELWLTQTMHKRVQRGEYRIVRKTRSKLRAEHCQWETRSPV